MAPLRLIIILSLTGLALAACGRAGAPEPPPGVTAPPVDDEGTEQVPERPFVLDGLLN